MHWALYPVMLCIYIPVNKEKHTEKRKKKIGRNKNKNGEEKHTSINQLYGFTVLHTVLTEEQFLDTK